MSTTLRVIRQLGIAFVLSVSVVFLATYVLNAQTNQNQPNPKTIAKGWTHPDGKPPSADVPSGSVFSSTFFVNKPYKDVWQFYAKKCGYETDYPDEKRALVVNAGKKCSVMHENLTLLGENSMATNFTYEADGYIVNAVLVSRKNGVRVFISVAIK